MEGAGAELTCSPEDPEALAEGVGWPQAMGEPARCELGRRGRRCHEEHFESEKLVTRVEAVMSEAIGELRCAS